MSFYKAIGINLKAYALGDTDKILIIYTREKGKIRVVAKGARRLTSKFGGRLEPFVCNRLLISEGRHLDILNQVETHKTFFDLRQSPEKMQMGLMFLKWIHQITEDRYADPKLFDLLFYHLEQLQISSSFSKVKHSFQHQVLLHQGVFSEQKVFREIDFQNYLQEYGVKVS